MTATLRVKVRAGASRNKVDVSSEGKVRIYVTAAPEAGKANDAIIVLLAKALGVGRRSITLVKGHTVLDKIFNIQGLDFDEAMFRLAKA